MPSWAQYLIEFGYNWPRDPMGGRRIAVISMPCDSAAAGLIVLGAMRRCLEDATANDIALHITRIEKDFIAYSQNCQELCPSSECDTKKVGCGLAQRIPNVLRNEDECGRFEFHRKDSTGVWVRKVQPLPKHYAVSITPGSASGWYFEGEAPVQVSTGEHLPFQPIYDELVPNAGPILDANLLRSYSGVCLAGRVAGESRTRSILADIRFGVAGEVAQLDTLSTVHAWNPGTASRVSFFNSRTGQVDRTTARPVLTIADGDSSFLRVMSKAALQQSDVVAVIDRTLDRERLEAVGLKLASLAQWYIPDVALLNLVVPTPKGISIAVLKRR